MCVYMTLCWVIVTPCVCMALRVCVGGGYVGDGVYDLVLGTVLAETSSSVYMTYNITHGMLKMSSRIRDL